MKPSIYVHSLSLPPSTPIYDLFGFLKKVLKYHCTEEKSRDVNMKDHFYDLGENYSSLSISF